MHEHVQRQFDALVSDRLAKLDAVFMLVQREKDLTPALRARDRERLEAVSSPLFHTLSRELGITHLNFLDPEGRIILRAHEPQVHGDQITRPTLRQAVESGRASHGLELGRRGTLSLRAVAPWQEGDDVIGHLEIGEEIAATVEDIRRILRCDCFLVLDKSLQERDHWLGENPAPDRLHAWERFPRTLVPIDVPEDLLQSLMEELSAGIRTAPSSGRLYRVGTTLQYGSFLPLRDGSGRVAANLVIISDVSEQVAFLDMLKRYSALAFIALGGLLVWVVSVHLKRAAREIKTAHRQTRDEAMRREELQASYIHELEGKSREIIEANRVLAERVDELTRFQRATVSRELRLKALHDENVLLRRQMETLQNGQTPLDDTESITRTSHG